MNKSITIFSYLVFSITFVVVVEGQERIDTIYNSYGQIIKIGEEKINYRDSAYARLVDEIDVNSANKSLVNNCDDPFCILWQDLSDFQVNDLIAFDADNDGVKELIKGTFNGIHVLSYNENIPQDRVVFSKEGGSKIPFDTIVVDGIKGIVTLDGDNLKKINIEKGEVDQCNHLEEYAQYHEGPVSVVKFGDADNDGIKDIVIGTTNKLYIVNASSLEIQYVLDLEGRFFEICNVDQDVEQEVVFDHGLVVEISQDGSFTEEYDFRSGIDEEWQLAHISYEDIDNDLVDEVIVTSFNKIEVFDAELENLKLSIPVDVQYAMDLTLYDINGDGIKELLYGDDQWGNVHCVDLQTGVELWTLDNPEWGIRGITVADFDNDEDLELIFGAGADWTQWNYLLSYDLSDMNVEWQSIDRFGGYNALEVIDLDQDGHNELITLSAASDRHIGGYGHGIFSIYDVISKELKFRTDEFFFHEGSTIYGSNNLSIFDYNDDGDLDILVASGFNTLSSGFWVVDGDTYEIEHEYIFTPVFENNGNSRILSCLVNDLDQDGSLEVIYTSKSNIYVANSQDFTVEWKSNEIIPSSNSERPDGLGIGNVDNDFAKEIVLCYERIYIYDLSDGSQIQSDFNDYSALKLYDWDGDGILEIYAGTSSGAIHVLDGLSLDIIDSYFVHVGQGVRGIDFIDINQDGNSVMIVTTENRVKLLYDDGTIIGEYKHNTAFGVYDAIEINDYDSNGEPNVFLGTGRGVFELDMDCFKCLLFDPVVSANDPNCDNEDGFIWGVSIDTTTNYILQSGEIFTDTIRNLGPGFYNVLAINDVGCEIEFTFELEGSNLEYSLESQDRTCEDNLDGQANILVTEGAIPFSYEWSNGGLTDTIGFLDTGIYYITVTDADECTLIDSVYIGQSVLSTNLIIDKLPCEDSEDGMATVSIVEGNGGYNYKWDSNVGNSSIENLTVGMHTVEVTDAYGCISVHEFELVPSVLNTEIGILQKPCPDQANGVARVNVLEGSVPYTYEWSDGLGTSPLVSNLLAGTYTVTTTDINNCSSIDTMVLDNLEINYSDDFISICEGESYSIGDSTWFSNGIYEYPINNCDSILRIELDVRISELYSLDISLCEGDTLWFLDQPYFESDIYNIIAEDSFGCDSLIELSLNVTNQIEKLDTLHLCQGDSLFVFDQYVFDEQLLSNSYQSQAGCDSNQYYQIELHDIPMTSLNIEICSGDSVLVANNWLDTTGDYELNVSYGGYCDSIYLVNVIVEELNTLYDTLSICEGDSIWLQDQWIYDQGNYEHIVTATPCDEVQATYIEIITPIVSNVDIFLCPNDSILLDDQWFYNDESITLEYVSSTGCDSLVITNIRKLNEPEEPIWEVDCEEQSILASIYVSDEWSILWSNNDTNPDTKFYEEGTAEVVLNALPDCQVSFDLILPSLLNESEVNEIANRTTVANQIIALEMNLDSNEYQVYWSPTEIIDCDTCFSVNITPVENTTIEVTIVHSSGCILYRSFDITILDRKEFDIPNIFSPNDDGINDNWTFTLPDDVDVISLQIYDRWGNNVAIWENEEIINWDGKYKGLDLVVGVYVYFGQYRDGTGGLQTIKGDITLIR